MTTTAPGFLGPPTRSSLVALKRAVEQYFAKQNIGAAVYLGLAGRDRWETSRVVLIDGEWDGTNNPRPMSAGTLVAPWHAKSYNPRELAGWNRIVTCSVRARDNTATSSEEAQLEATELLIEQTMQALRNAVAFDPVDGAAQGVGQANIDWQGSKAMWVEPGSSTQQTSGKEFLFSFTYRCTFFDAADFYQQVTGQIQKGPLLTSKISGANAEVRSASATAGTAVVSNLGNLLPGCVGMTLALSGAASGPNNGAFPISFFLSPSSVVIANPGAVAPDGNNGSIAWKLGPPP